MMNHDSDSSRLRNFFFFFATVRIDQIIKGRLGADLMLIMRDQLTYLLVYIDLFTIRNGTVKKTRY